MGKRAGDAVKSMLACFDRVQGRRRGQEQRKAEFRARELGWFGEGRWTVDNKKSPVNFHARSKMLAALRSTLRLR